MRLLVSLQLTMEECLREGELTHYLIVFIIHDLIYYYSCQMIQKCIQHLASYFLSLVLNIVCITEKNSAFASCTITSSAQ